MWTRTADRRLAAVLGLSAVGLLLLLLKSGSTPGTDGGAEFRAAQPLPPPTVSVAHDVAPAPLSPVVLPQEVTTPVAQGVPTAIPAFLAQDATPPSAPPVTPPISSFLPQMVAATAPSVLLPPSVATPATGVMEQWFSGSPRPKFKVVTRPRDGNKYIKIVQAITPHAPIATAFVRDGEELSFRIPPGEYLVKIASGDTWYGTTYLFGPSTVCTLADDPFPFTDDGSSSSGWTVELFKQEHGNLQQTPIKIEDF